MEEITKSWYSTDELANMSWFPAKSPSTIRTLIRLGKLEAINVSSTGVLPRFKISKESILKYLVSCGVDLILPPDDLKPSKTSISEVEHTKSPKPKSKHLKTQK